MHEREWRLPVPPHQPWLYLDPSTVAAVLVGDPAWQPTWRQIRVETGWYVNGMTGEDADRGDMYAQSVTALRTGLPRLWPGLVKMYWDATAGRIVPIQ